MLVVGLTGGTACGKSTVTAELRKAGIPVIDADLLAKQTTEKVCVPGWHTWMGRVGPGERRQTLLATFTDRTG